MVTLDIQNLSTIKRLYRARDLTQLAERICKGEGARQPLELSLVLCDDPFITELNRVYRKKDEATDVLSFQQEAPAYNDIRLLGDIVISLETVERFCEGDRNNMREELRLLFCHGLLHLLGHTHSKARDRDAMQSLQAAYLGTDVNDAWHG